MVSFEYDPLGRRISKTYKEKTTRWVWDGNVPLHEWTEESDVTTWLFEEGTFIPAAKIVGDKSYSIITDYLGTPTEMYNSDGEKTWSAELDIYGSVRNFAGRSLSDCPFRYQGQYEDEETGLYYNWFRYYSPDSGIYISQDPIRLSGGIQLYGYIKDSNYFIDLLGLRGMPKGGWNYGNMPKIDGYQLHHVIPKSMADHPAIKAAGFDVNKPSNLIYLPKETGIHPTRSVHDGWNKGHADYNVDIKQKLNEIHQIGDIEGWSKQQYSDAIEDLRGDTRKGLREGKIKCH